MATIGKLSYILGLDTVNFRTQLTASERWMRNWRVSAEKDLNHITGMASRTALGMVALGAGAAYVSSKFLDAASKAEMYKVRLEMLTGSQELSADLFAKMETYAARVTHTYEDVMEAGAAFSGVMKGGNDEVMKWIQMAGDLAAVTPLTFKEVIGQVIRLYSAGANSADLFRERGTLAMLGFQANVKYTAQESRDQFIAAWESADSKFKNGAQRLQATWSGMVSKMQDQWFFFRKDVMEAGLFELFKGELQGLMDKIDEMKASGSYEEFITNFVYWSGAAFETVKQLTGSLVTMGKALVEYSNGWNKMFSGMNWTTPFNPADWSGRLAGGAGSFKNMINIFGEGKKSGQQSWAEFQVWAEKILDTTKKLKAETSTTTGGGTGGGPGGVLAEGWKRGLQYAKEYQVWFDSKGNLLFGSQYMGKQWAETQVDIKKRYKEMKAEMPALIEVDEMEEPEEVLRNWKDAWSEAMVDIRAEFYGPDSLYKDFVDMGMNIQDSWGRTIEGLITGTVKFHNLFKQMFLDVAGSFARLASQNIARKLFESTIGSLSPDSLGGFGGLFGGGMSLSAAGGGVSIGTLNIQGNDARAMRAILDRASKRRA